MLNMLDSLGTAGVLVAVQFACGVSAQSPASCRGVVFDSDRTQIPPVYRTPDLYLIASDGAGQRQLRSRS